MRDKKRIAVLKEICELDRFLHESGDVPKTVEKWVHEVADTFESVYTYGDGFTGADTLPVFSKLILEHSTADVFSVSAILGTLGLALFEADGGLDGYRYGANPETGGLLFGTNDEVKEVTSIFTRF